jgi:hypothetical protein
MPYILHTAADRQAMLDAISVGSLEEWLTTVPAELLHQAPHTTSTSRPDEVQAARKPILKWTPET